MRLQDLKPVTHSARHRLDAPALALEIAPQACLLSCEGVEIFP